MFQRHRPEWVALFLLLASAAPFGTAYFVGAAPPVLHVGCQIGQPPYVDSGSALGNRSSNAKPCDGIFAEIFFTAAARAGLVINTTVVEAADIDPFLYPNATNNHEPSTQPLFDAFIAFHTITPSRAQLMDFSPTVYQTMYRIGLDPTYHKGRITLISTILRKSVLYVLAVVAVASAIFAPVIFIFESYFPRAEEGNLVTPLLQLPLYQRVFYCMEMSIEAALTASTAANFVHPVTRFCRTIVGVLGFMYLINIFSAIMTAQLTTSALNAGDPTLLDVRGAHVASASPPLTAYLSGVQFGVTILPVPNVEAWAEGFYNGSHLARGDTVHGYVAPEQTVEYLHSLHGADAGGFTMTAPFSPTGSRDLKAFPWARRAVEASDAFDLFNVALQAIREDGTLVRIIDRWIPAVSTPSVDDFPTDPAAVAGVSITVIILLCVVAVVTLGLFVYDTAAAATNAGDEDELNVSSNNSRANAAKAPEQLTWRGRPFDVSSPELKRVLDAIVASAQREVADAASNDGRPAQRRRTLLGLPIDSVPPA